MSVHDDRLVAGSAQVRAALEILDGAIENEREATRDKKLAASLLLKLGLSSRYVGAKIGVSHVTVLAWKREVDI